LFDVPVTELILFFLLIHLFFFVGFQYQLLNMLDEIAFPSNDPIMTSTLEAEEPEEEEAIDISEVELDQTASWQSNTDADAEQVAAEAAKPYQRTLTQYMCQGLNKSGKQCGRYPSGNSDYCYRHK
jgi:hypothetical protein